MIKTFLNEIWNKNNGKKREIFDKLRNLSKKLAENRVFLAKNKNYGRLYGYK